MAAVPADQVSGVATSMVELGGSRESTAAPVRGVRRPTVWPHRLPAHHLQRILGLSAHASPSASLEEFARELAHTAAEVGGLAFAVTFLYDAVDDTFYAEAGYNLDAGQRRELLALSMPSRVYDRLVGSPDDAGPYVLPASDRLFADPEVLSCIGPLLQGSQSAPGHAVAAKAEATNRQPAPAGAGLVLLPLESIGRGRLGAVVGYFGHSGRRFSRTTRAALALLAAQGGILWDSILQYSQEREEAAVSSALLQVAAVVGSNDLDVLVQRTLAVLPQLFGGQFAALLYLDPRRTEMRMLEPKGPSGRLTGLTEVKLLPQKFEQLQRIVRGAEPLDVDESQVGRVLPDRLVHARSLKSALIIPLSKPNQPADALAVFWSEASHRFRPRDLDVARGVADLVGIALANAQLYSEAHARAEQLSALYQTGQIMSSSLDLDGTLKTISNASVQLTQSRSCFIYLVNETTGLLDYAAGTGHTHAAAPPASIRPGEGLFGRCALKEVPIVVEDLRVPAGGSTSFEPMLATGVRSAMVLPLLANGALIGVLGTAADPPGFYLAEHQQLLHAFANQAAFAIERARLYAAQLRRREIAELQQTMTHALGSTLDLDSVLRQVLRYVGLLMPADLTCVHIWQDGSVQEALVRSATGEETSEPLHTGETLLNPLYAQMRIGSATVVSHTAREPLWHAPLTSAPVGSWIGVPLFVEGDYIVVLDLYSYEQGAYSQQDADNLGQFAQHVGFAVRNARIYAREHQAKIRLEEVEQLRVDFVSTVSHELRTPLTGIRGFTETLLTYWSRLDEPHRQQYLQRIHKASKRLERLVQDLLFVSNVEGGLLPLTIMRVPVQELLSGAVEEIRQKYRGLVVEVHAAPEIPDVTADPDRVQQILVALLDNAAKYSPEGAPVRAECVLSGDWVEFSVVDTGPGIQPSDLPRLFTRFGKIDQVTRESHVGTGLGLFIAKQLVQQMQGTLAVHSVVGQGSRFAFTLPRADVEP
jgi:signal transduction histidine kinase